MQRGFYESFDTRSSVVSDERRPHCKDCISVASSRRCSAASESSVGWCLAIPSARSRKKCRLRHPLASMSCRRKAPQSSPNDSNAQASQIASPCPGFRSANSPSSGDSKPHLWYRQATRINDFQNRHGNSCNAQDVLPSRAVLVSNRGRFLRWKIRTRRAFQLRPESAIVLIPIVLRRDHIASLGTS